MCVSLKIKAQRCNKENHLVESSMATGKKSSLEHGTTENVLWKSNFKQVCFNFLLQVTILYNTRSLWHLKYVCCRLKLDFKEQLFCIFGTLLLWKSLYTVVPLCTSLNDCFCITSNIDYAFFFCFECIVMSWCFVIMVLHIYLKTILYQHIIII